MRGTGGSWATAMYHTHTPFMPFSASAKKISKTCMLHNVQVRRDGKQRQAPCYIIVNGPFNNRSGGVPLKCSKISRLEWLQRAIYWHYWRTESPIMASLRQRVCIVAAEYLEQNS
jgi:hypothetical protein